MLFKTAYVLGTMDYQQTILQQDNLALHVDKVRELRASIQRPMTREEVLKFDYYEYINNKFDIQLLEICEIIEVIRFFRNYQ
jgi:hypothetical protein